MCGSRSHRTSRGHENFSMLPVSTRFSENVTPYINEGLQYCLNCGQTFNSDNVKFCNKCGSEIQICPVSRNIFRTGDNFAQCPLCGTVFHYHHLTDWLRNNNRCPNCREKLDSIHRGIIGINYLY
ncbi:MAG: RING finger domain-containing protein [Candidatus Kariarchaeaceae archaeon]|jgi:rRNA maturation endonuclease Nob1